MIIPPSTSRRHALPTLDSFVEDAMAEVSVQIVPLVSRGDVNEVPVMLNRASLEVRQLAEVVGDREIGEAIDATTEHAWLVVLGHLARVLGLVAGLEEVPIGQRRGPRHTPQSKVIEFLVGILGGIDYLQDLKRGSHPIVTDPTIAKAWAQDLFAHYSGVSRTLEAADEETLAAVVGVLRMVSRPFIEAAVLEVIKQTGHLTVDVDLTGREVSPTSTDYLDADFGWMDDEVSKGYQAAVTSLVCDRWHRLMLTLQRYTGRTQSAECLQAAVQEVEAVLGVRPRRRVELVQARRQEVVAQMERLQARLDRNRQAEERFWARIREAKAEAQVYQCEVAHLEADYRALGRQERPHSRLAKTRRRLASAQKRKARAWRNLKQIQLRIANQQNQMMELQDTLLTLDEWLAYLDADNRPNPNPVSIVLRIDAGFSTGPNLAWLIEMGYTVLTKAHHSSTAHSLRRRLPAQTDWTRVGRNAEAVSMGDYYQNDCPYPLQAMLVRYHLPGETRYTTLFYYDEAPPPVLPAWFARYNGRQTIEAGIKEGKTVFTLKRHLVRSPIGMQLQEQFALFGANFVRWAAAWVKDMLRHANSNFVAALGQVKTLVRIVSHVRARWVRNALGNTLIFDEAGPFAGTVICLTGQVALQLTLPLFNFAPL
ncbi:MAG: hypothetical protein E3J21_11665 [Anaerolineales bacterium]|nr:MAG: hypothetical protein E3J21_11665 [Anaerolineales bacterium]